MGSFCLRGLWGAYIRTTDDLGLEAPSGKGDDTVDDMNPAGPTNANIVCVYIYT